MFNGIVHTAVNIGLATATVEHATQASRVASWSAEYQGTYPFGQ